MSVEAVSVRARHVAGARALAWWIGPSSTLLAAAAAFGWTLHAELQRLYGMTGSAWDFAYDQQVIWNISVGQGFYELCASQLPRHPLRAHLRAAGGGRKILGQPGRAPHLLLRRPGRNGARRLPLFPCTAARRQARVAVAGRRAVASDSGRGGDPGGGSRPHSPGEP